MIRSLVALGAMAILLAVIARLPTSNAQFTTVTGAGLATNAGDMLAWESGSLLGADLIWWLDASETSTLYSDASCTTPAAAQGTVGCWKDRRPGWSQANTSAGPTRNGTGINGRNTVQFDNYDYLSGPNMYPTASTTSTTIFIVFRENVRQYNFLLSLNGDNITATRFSFSVPWGNGIHYFDAGDASTDRVRSVSTETVVGATTLITAWKQPNTMLNYMEVNGNRYASTGFASAQTTGGLRLGASGGYGSHHDVAEILIFDRVMGDAERTTIATYLKNKWATP